MMSATRQVGALLRTTRPRQWIKNLSVFLPLLFTINEIWTPDDPAGALEFAGLATGAALIFCVLSGGIYLLNDAVDVDLDRAHPVKRNRPIASGAVSVRTAVIVAVLLLAAGIGLSFALRPWLGAVAAAYVLIQVAYSFRLKDAILLDVFSVASGFVLRVVAGAVALGAPISPWLYICTALGALFIALTKRRSELARAGGAASEQRGILGSYTLGVLDQMITIVATSALVSYALYTFFAENLPGNNAMMLTTPFVIYGLFRYLYLSNARDAGESPEDLLLGDFPLMVSVGLWLASGAAILLIYR